MTRVLTIVLAGWLTGTATLARQVQPFRSSADLVSLNVTVTDANRRFVHDLDESNFAVFEDGVRQDIVVFSPRPRAIALSLLLDSSSSMRLKLSTLQHAARNFVRRLAPDDLAEIVDFDNNVRTVKPFTSNQAELEAAIGEISAGGATALFNAVYISLRSLERMRAKDEEEDLRRRGLIVFSDGMDTSSLMSFDEVLDVAKRSQTTIYTIGQRDDPVEPLLLSQEGTFVLRRLAEETGGRAFLVTKITELVGVYEQIADELASQYSLGYSSSNPRRDGKWRQVNVQLSEGTLTARTRKGYFAPMR
jgi:Ca-activated chloride channel family protein